jgi:hypothetical protein
MAVLLLHYRSQVCCIAVRSTIALLPIEYRVYSDTLAVCKAATLITN